MCNRTLEYMDIYSLYPRERINVENGNLNILFKKYGCMET